MKYSNRLRLAAAGLIYVIVAVACATPVAQAPAPAAAAPTEAPQAPTQAPGAAQDKLRIGIPYYRLVDPALLEILAQAQKDTGLQLEVAIPQAAYAENPGLYKDLTAKYGILITDVLIIDTPLPFLAATGGCIGVLPPRDISQFDLYMLDSQCAAHMFAAFPFDPAPDAVQPLPNFKAPFTQKGTLAAAPMGTMPMLAIGNANALEKLNVNPKSLMDWSWDTFIQMAADGAGDPTHYRVVVPSDTVTLVVGCQSALGTKACSEENIFSGAVIPEMSGMIEQGNKLFSLKNVYFPQELASEGGTAKVLANGDVVGAYAPVGLLTELGRLEAQGTALPPLALGRFPTIKESGGSAETRAWAVPASSKQKGGAWQLVKWLDENEDMKRWLLAHDMLPATATGWNQLLKKPELASGQLPKAVLSEGWLSPLHDITLGSKAWQIPAPVNLTSYNAMMDFTNGILMAWARGQATTADLFAKLVTVLKGL